MKRLEISILIIICFFPNNRNILILSDISFESLENGCSIKKKKKKKI